MVRKFPYQVKTFVAQETADRVAYLCGLFGISRSLLCRSVLLPDEEDFTVSREQILVERVHQRRAQRRQATHKNGDGMRVVNVDLTAAQFALVEYASFEWRLSMREYFGSRLDTLRQFSDEQIEPLSHLSNQMIEQKAVDLLAKIEQVTDLPRPALNQVADL